MAGLKVSINVRDAAEAMRGAFEEVGNGFARAVQFNLTRVGIEATRRFSERIPLELKHANAFTRKAVRYEVDRGRLDSVTGIDDAKAAVFILPMQSVWLKYALGEETRAPGDVGIEGWFPHQDNIYLPNARGLETQGIHPGAGGTFKGADVRRIARGLAAGYQRNTDVGGRWGVFEIRAGDKNPARLDVGVHARPPRALALRGRARLADKVKRGKAVAPRTRFQDGRGRQVDVPRVVNMDVPRLLFLARPQGTYKPVLSPSWEDEMQKAASKFADWMLDDLADKMEHAAARGGRRR